MREPKLQVSLWCVKINAEGVVTIVAALSILLRCWWLHVFDRSRWPEERLQMNEQDSGAWLGEGEKYVLSWPKSEKATKPAFLRGRSRQNSRF